MYLQTKNAANQHVENDIRDRRGGLHRQPLHNRAPGVRLRRRGHRQLRQQRHRGQRRLGGPQASREDNRQIGQVLQLRPARQGQTRGDLQRGKIIYTQDL